MTAKPAVASRPQNNQIPATAGAQQTLLPLLQLVTRVSFQGPSTQFLVQSYPAPTLKNTFISDSHLAFPILPVNLRNVSSV